MLDYASDAVSDAAPASVSRATVDAGVRLAAVLVAVSVVRSLLGLVFAVGAAGLALLVASKVMAEGGGGGSGGRRGGGGGRGRGGRGRSVQVFRFPLFFFSSLRFVFSSLPLLLCSFKLTPNFRNPRHEKTETKTNQGGERRQGDSKRGGASSLPSGLSSGPAGQRGRRRRRGGGDDGDGNGDGDLLDVWFIEPGSRFDGSRAKKRPKQREEERVGSGSAAAPSPPRSRQQQQRRRGGDGSDGDEGSSPGWF